MKERPILFSAPMVRAILDGRKTQTRRKLKAGWIVEKVDEPNWYGKRVLVHRPTCQLGFCEKIDDGELACGGYELSADGIAVRSPYGHPGDRLWVRETWHSCGHCGAGSAHYRAGGWIRRPRVDGPDRDDFDLRPLAPKCAAHGWRPSIHMPRWASRISIDVSEVRLERLQEISDDDARSEGVERDIGRDVPAAMGPTETWLNYVDPDNWCSSPQSSYRTLWESINGAGSWATNDWVWAITFRRVQP